MASAQTVKSQLLEHLAKYPLCNFFLHACVESMSDEQIAGDLAKHPDFSLLRHFDNPEVMCRLEELFDRTMKIFVLTKEELKASAEFNFDVYDPTGFESVRAVFRLAVALSEVGFSHFAFLKGNGMADLSAVEKGNPWIIEVKTLVLQTKEEEFEVDGAIEILAVDKFQPETRRIADYQEKVSRQMVGNLVPKARQQLLDTANARGEARKMVAIVINLFAADFFLDADGLGQMSERLRGRWNGWD